MLNAISAGKIFLCFIVMLVYSPMAGFTKVFGIYVMIHKSKDTLVFGKLGGFFCVFRGIFIVLT